MQYKSLIFILVTPFCMGLTGLQAQTASWCRTMGCASVDVLRIFSLKKNGYSVRCIKD